MLAVTRVAVAPRKPHALADYAHPVLADVQKQHQIARFCLAYRQAYPSAACQPSRKRCECACLQRFNWPGKIIQSTQSVTKITNVLNQCRKPKLSLLRGVTQVFASKALCGGRWWPHPLRSRCQTVRKSPAQRLMPHFFRLSADERSTKRARQRACAQSVYLDA